MPKGGSAAGQTKPAVREGVRSYADSWCLGVRRTVPPHYSDFPASGSEKAAGRFSGNEARSTQDRQMQAGVPAAASKPGGKATPRHQHGAVTSPDAATAHSLAAPHKGQAILGDGVRPVLTSCRPRGPGWLRRAACRGRTCGIRPASSGSCAVPRRIDPASPRSCRGSPAAPPHRLSSDRF